MSIIHEALKKAAAEETAPGNPALARVRHSLKWPPFFSPSAVLFIGFFVLALFSSFVSLQYLKHRPLSFSKKEESLSSPSTLNPPASQGRLIDSNPKVDLRKDEGKEALARGLDLYRKGKIAPAMEAFDRAVSLSPQSPIAHNNLGLVFKRQGRLSEAMSHYREALRFDPLYAEALNNLGLAYDQLGSVDEAASYYKKALGLKPNVAAFHLNYGALLERKGDFSQARQEYQSYLRLESDPQKESAVALVKERLKEIQGL